MRVTTAVIFAAGYGSRMLPVTAAIQKELVPILDRPVVDYVVADCVAAGIQRIIFVVRPGSRGLQDYYLGNAGLEDHLRRQGKQAALDILAQVQAQANFEFVEQPPEAGYGTAIPIRYARPHLPADEAVLVCGGDDFMWHPDGTSEISRLVGLFHATKSIGALMALERPTDELFRYGVLSVEQRGEYEYLKTLIEKPEPGTEPSNLINISKYILTPQLLDYVDQVAPDPKSGEYFITDAILEAAQEHPLVVHRAGGEFLDAGNVTSWLHANLAVAATRNDIRPHITS